MGVAIPTTAPSADYFVLRGLSPEAARPVLDALADARVYPAYDGDALEIPRLIHGLSPEAYCKLIDALPDHHPRHSYDDWTLEFMTHGKDHEWSSRLLGRMLEAMVLALDIPIQSVGSTTLRSALRDKGLEPDESYYIANEPLVRGRRMYRPGEDLPPDLTIEVDVTSAVVKRLPIYARLGVPEIWRHVEDEVRIYRLDEGEYRVTDRSVSFPWLTGSDLTRFLNQREEKDENSVVRGFVQWAKKAHRKWWQSQK